MSSTCMYCLLQTELS